MDTAPDTTEQWLDHVTDLGRQRHAARNTYMNVNSQLRQAVINARKAGCSELGTSKAAGVDRATVRSWTGKDELAGQTPQG